VSGSKNREEVRKLIKGALETGTQNQWRATRSFFDTVTGQTYEKAKKASLGGLFGDLKGWSRQRQYDRHAQVIVRLCDQYRRPVLDYDIYFGRPASAKSKGDIADLIVDTHRNDKTTNVLTFFLRVGRWNEKDSTWHDQLDQIDGVVLEVVGNEPQTDDIQYVPFRLELDRGALKKWIVPHTTTVMDIEMLRVPTGNVFRVFKY
jgi:hypothetical protein